jgi:hypothetical protein
MLRDAAIISGFDHGYRVAVVGWWRHRRFLLALSSALTARLHLAEALSYRALADDLRRAA